MNVAPPALTRSPTTGKPPERAEDEAADRRVVVLRHRRVPNSSFSSPMFVVPATTVSPVLVVRTSSTSPVVVLVANLADDLLEQILHRHDARGAAVLVEHDRHVLLAPLEIREHVLDLRAIPERSTPAA